MGISTVKVNIRVDMMEIVGANDKEVDEMTDSLESGVGLSVVESGRSDVVGFDVVSVASVVGVSDVEVSAEVSDVEESVESVVKESVESVESVVEESLVGVSPVDVEEPEDDSSVVVESEASVVELLDDVPCVVSSGRESVVSSLPEVVVSSLATKVITLLTKTRKTRTRFSAALAKILITGSDNL